MSLVASPNGLVPVSKLGANVNNEGFSEFVLTADNANAIGMWDLVNFSAGTIKSVSTAPAAGTVSASSPVGLFAGVSYTDPILGLVFRPYLPANIITTLTNAGAPTPIVVKVKVVDDPNIVMRIQGTGYIGNGGSVPTFAQAMATVGKNINIKSGTLSVPNAVNGSSSMSADTTTVATTATFPLRIVGFATNPGSNPTDPFPDLLVRWNFGTHLYQQGLGI